ncbi:unnamed protein product [Mycena citricolor]|uniref:Uncharacterized protein n=1 Tax=Mycena citricolor TaxID=2018698 RepID=A0AAD2Q2C8_9AGAR|nr:unnamed protein product [Mycena citricolor]
MRSFTLTTLTLALFALGDARPLRRAIDASVRCAATDQTGSALTASSTTTDSSGNEFSVCTYKSAGPCTFFFADGSFSSGSSDCPKGQAQTAGAGTGGGGGGSSAGSSSSSSKPQGTLDPNVKCPAKDKQGSSVTSSSQGSENGNALVTCTYAVAGPCTFFTDGSFSSGGSDCPAGQSQGSSQQTTTTSAPPPPPKTTAAPPPPPKTTVAPPPPPPQTTTSTPPPPPPPATTSTPPPPPPTTTSTPPPPPPSTSTSTTTSTTTPPVTTPSDTPTVAPVVTSTSAAAAAPPVDPSPVDSTTSFTTVFVTPTDTSTNTAGAPVTTDVANAGAPAGGLGQTGAAAPGLRAGASSLVLAAGVGLAVLLL